MHLPQFSQLVLPEINKRGMAGLGMKSLGGTVSQSQGVASVEESLRYAMSLAVATTSAESIRCGLAPEPGHRSRLQAHDAEEMAALKSAARSQPG